MAKIYHFENNLYYINESLSVLENILQLSLDQEFFFDKIIEDIIFIDAIVSKISEQLQNNPHGINLQSVLRNVYLTQVRYIEFLKNILRNHEEMELPISAFIPKLEQIKKHHQDEMDKLSSVLDNPLEENSDLVSSEEYQFLFDDSDEITS